MDGFIELDVGIEELEERIAPGIAPGLPSVGGLGPAGNAGLHFNFAAAGGVWLGKGQFC